MKFLNYARGLASDSVTYVRSSFGRMIREAGL